MKVRILTLAAALALGACSSGTSSSSCAEYAAEVRTLIDSGAPATEIQQFLDDTEEHVAKLIMDDPNRGQACGDAILEAVFSAGFDELFEEL